MKESGDGATEGLLNEHIYRSVSTVVSLLLFYDVSTYYDLYIL